MYSYINIFTLKFITESLLIEKFNFLYKYNIKTYLMERSKHLLEITTRSIKYTITVFC